MKNLHNPFVVQHTFIPLSKTGIMHGAKYTSKRYSGGIIGDISLVSTVKLESLEIHLRDLYDVKNEFSMQMILHPNMEFIRQRLIKGTESIPLNAESFGRN